MKRAGAVGMARGTCIEVRDLFFNTPARRKFLRREETEFGHIGDVVTKLALARPGVHFRLVHNERTVLEVFRQGSLAERVASLLGRPLLRDLLPLERAENGLRLHGLISQPAVHRPGAGAVYTFINGRYIRDRVVQHALLEGYRSVLEKGRYPVAVLFLEIAPEEVDVNVHPTKHEVRFREQSLVHSFLAGAVRDCLRPGDWLSGGTAQRPELSRPPTPATVPMPGQAAADLHRDRVQEALLSYSVRNPATTPVETAAHALPVPAAAPAGFFHGLEVLGQYRRSYLLCQDGDDLLLIDQHAAHERIGFERLKKEYWGGRIERQALLFPGR